MSELENTSGYPNANTSTCVSDAENTVGEYQDTTHKTTSDTPFSIKLKGGKILKGCDKKIVI